MDNKQASEQADRPYKVGNRHGMGTECCVCCLRLKQGYQSHMRYHERQGAAVVIAGRWFKIQLASERTQ